MKSFLTLTLATILTSSIYKQSDAIPVPMPKCGGLIPLKLKLDPKDVTEECNKNLHKMIQELPNVGLDDVELKAHLNKHGCGKLFKSIMKQTRDAIRKSQHEGGGSCDA